MASSVLTSPVSDLKHGSCVESKVRSSGINWQQKSAAVREGFFSSFQSFPAVCVFPFPIANSGITSAGREA